MTVVPDEARAHALVRSVLGEPARSLVRFPTGLHHWVYDVVLESGRALVLRVASPPNRSALVGAVYWHERIRSVGIPLAEILHAEVHAELPFLVLERLPGADLGHVYGELTEDQRSALARRIAELQARAAGLPEARGYGYALDYESPLAPEWRGVLRHSLRRGRRWLEQGGGADVVWADRIAEGLAGSEDAFADIRPRAFLHDTTTKNVIVDGGELAGIVDVDSMAFGDPLWTVALTRMSLLASRQPTDYIDAWCDAMGREHAPAPRLDLYTALHGLNFLGELGQAFNRDAPAPVDTAEREYLEQILADLLAR